jgi:carboxylesterase type B
MGESAGAMGVGHHINTMIENPPFRAAIEMSGSSIATAPQLGESDPDAPWRELLQLLECDEDDEDEVLECIRAADARNIQTLINENGIQSNQFTQDNVTVLERPDVAWAAGKAARVPLMIGSTKDDGSIFVRDAAVLADASGFDIETLLATMQVPEDQEKIILQLYGPDSPYGNFSTAGDVLYAYSTDATFRCTSGFVANLTSNILGVPVWQYVFDSLVPSNTWEEWPEIGVYHASELPLVFGTYRRDNSNDLEAALSRSMQKQFADFIRDPQQGPGWAQWPEVGVLTVDNGEVVTPTEDVRELDPICQQFDMVFAAQLPALAQAGSSNGSAAGGSTGDDEAQNEANFGVKAGVSGWVMAGTVLLAVAVAV